MEIDEREYRRTVLKPNPGLEESRELLASANAGCEPEEGVGWPPRLPEVQSSWRFRRVFTHQSATTTSSDNNNAFAASGLLNLEAMLLSMMANFSTGLSDAELRSVKEQLKTSLLLAAFSNIYGLYKGLQMNPSAKHSAGPEIGRMTRVRLFGAYLGALVDASGWNVAKEFIEHLFTPVALYLGAALRNSRGEEEVGETRKGKKRKNRKKQNKGVRGGYRARKALRREDGVRMEVEEEEVDEDDEENEDDDDKGAASRRQPPAGAPAASPAASPAAVAVAAAGVAPAPPSAAPTPTAPHQPPPPQPAAATAAASRHQHARPRSRRPPSAAPTPTAPPHQPPPPQPAATAATATAAAVAVAAPAPAPAAATTTTTTTTTTTPTPTPTATTTATTGPCTECGGVDTPGIVPNPFDFGSWRSYEKFAEEAKANLIRRGLLPQGEQLPSWCHKCRCKQRYVGEIERSNGLVLARFQHPEEKVVRREMWYKVWNYLDKMGKA